MNDTDSPSAPPIALSQYRTGEGVYDEWQAADGAMRPQYGRLLENLSSLTPADLKNRADTCRRLVHEQGITYNVYDDSRNAERPWQLDPLPIIIGSDEWRALEAGLIQRATLINRILADCYGPQELIRSKWLPPALVFAQPDFLRPCHGIRTPDDVFLHFYACDLARSPDGRWWVVSDRTQIPTGAGYALANRLVTSRLFPETFRDCQVNRLAGFFRDLQHALAGLGKHKTDDPRIVVLTPGPYNETYSEQSYLARYLGYSLVEGQDLTVRDDRVFLKTLSGLEPVDVIVRRVDDDFCDPLELRNDSMLGVPGLVEAMRAGNVAVANALGSGLLQSPAFMPFLPGLCRQILAEPLKLHSAATWWCGQEEARKYVLENLESMYVKPISRSSNRLMNPGQPLSTKQLEELKSRILFKPENFVAQELVELSTAPYVTENGIVPRRVSLRAFLVRHNGSYRVMPGALARVAAAEPSRSISMRRGGGSKDTWILSDKPVEDISLLLEPGRPIELRRVGNNLPSRMADNFFWMGRYAERAAATSRLLRSALTRFNPENTLGALPVLGPLLTTLETQGVLTSSAVHPDVRANPEVLEAELLAAIFDADRPESLRAVSEKLDRLAMLARERTSSDLWRVLTQLNAALTPSADATFLNGPANGSDTKQQDHGTPPSHGAQKYSDSTAADVLNDVLMHIAALHGMARENMTRAQGWRFLDIGCRVERSLQLCALIDATLSSPNAENPSLLEAVLEVCDSTITYRSRYSLMPHLAAVLDLVLLDDTNPRSLLFQLNQLVKHFDRLPLEQRSALPTPSQRILIECITRLRLLDPRLITSGQTRKANVPHTPKIVAASSPEVIPPPEPQTPGVDGARGDARPPVLVIDNSVQELVRQALRDLPRMSEAIAVSYFAHSAISRAGAKP
jgi:uncharacterized circularly permuted ATP-grasp superfamily protein/uncharacterized alpha-E superfamily protein